jgi:hypothetical protein
MIANAHLVEAEAVVEEDALASTAVKKYICLASAPIRRIQTSFVHHVETTVVVVVAHSVVAAHLMRRKFSSGGWEAHLVVDNHEAGRLYFIRRRHF